jgi:hypothetical protein
VLRANRTAIPTRDLKAPVKRDDPSAMALSRGICRHFLKPRILGSRAGRALQRVADKSVMWIFGPCAEWAAFVFSGLGTDRILGLFKFGTHAHINDFVRGTLYMNPLRYFAQLEADEHSDLRRDSFEGVGRLIQADGAILSVKVEGDYQPVGKIAGAMQWRPNEGIQANLFCMYALREPTHPQFIDPLNLRFGDTFAVFTNGDEFLERVRNAAMLAGHNLRHGLVEYIDEHQHHGEVGIFRKRLRFAYQSEFRLAIVPGVATPYCLHVGDLSDIAITGPLAQLNDLLRLQEP